MQTISNAIEHLNKYYVDDARKNLEGKMARWKLANRILTIAYNVIRDNEGKHLDRRVSTKIWNSLKADNIQCVVSWNKECKTVTFWQNCGKECVINYDHRIWIGFGSNSGKVYDPRDNEFYFDKKNYDKFEAMYIDIEHIIGWMNNCMDNVIEHHRKYRDLFYDMQ